MVNSVKNETIYCLSSIILLGGLFFLISIKPSLQAEPINLLDNIFIIGLSNEKL